VGAIDRHSSALRAVRKLLVASGLPADRLETWKDGSNLLVRPVPAPVIFRVATFTGRVRGDPMPYLRRELELVTWLAARGAPVMAPADVLDPGPHLVDGWGIVAWRFEEHEAGVVPSGRATLDALDALHGVMDGYPGELPLLGPATTDLDLAFGFAERDAILDAGVIATLRARRDELVARLLSAGESVVPQHGDAFPRNTLVTPRGVVWIDLEDACLAPRAWDLAVLVRNTDDPAVRAAAVRRVGEEPLVTAMDLREIQAGVWQALHHARVTRGW
jgi:hypothetical protein